MIKSLLSNLFSRTYIIHAGCWSLFIIYELLTIHAVLGHLGSFKEYLVYYPINISFFYAYVSILNRTFNRSSIKYFRGLVAYVLLITFFLIIKSLIDFLFINSYTDFRNQLHYIGGLIPKNFFRGLYFTVLGTFYWSAGHISYFRNQKFEAERERLLVQTKNADLQNQLIQSQNAYLQQQINPHLLFNSLNFVYSITQRYSDEAADCIWLLSEIMRFSLEKTGVDGKIDLEREAEQISNLFSINRYRYQEPIYVSIEMEGNFSGCRIIPLVLLTLTENVFKHGNLQVEDHPGKIKIIITDAGKLIYYSRNLKKNKTSQQRSQQIGLHNSKIRLNTFYANRYSLNISEPENFYELTLILNL